MERIFKVAKSSNYPGLDAYPQAWYQQNLGTNTCDDMLVVQTRTVVILTQEQVSKHNMSIHVIECY